MSIDRNDFIIKNTSITDDGEGWKNFLRELFIADPDYADKYRSLVGTIRIPVKIDGDTKPRTKTVNEKDPTCINIRSARVMMFENYLKEKNLKGTDFRYVEIIYTGPRKNGWYEYDNTLAKFIDYILPLLKERVKEVSVDDVVFTEHASPEKEPVSMHVLYTSSEPGEFTAIWNLYLDFLEQKEKKEKEENSNQDYQNSETEKKEASEQNSEEKESINTETTSSKEETIENTDVTNEKPSESKTSSEADENEHPSNSGLTNEDSSTSNCEEPKGNSTPAEQEAISEETFIPNEDDLPDNGEENSSEDSEYSEIEEEEPQEFGDLNLEPTEEEYADEND